MTKEISITAEAVSFFRYKENKDQFSKLFVTKRINFIYKIISLLAPKLAKNISKRRVELSNLIEKEIIKNKPMQIIELASGFSTLGLRLPRKDKKINYIELDLPNVIKRKKQVLEKNKIKINKNHHLVSIDLISQDLLKKIKPHISKSKKTVIFSEGLNPYLSNEEHDFLSKNILSVLNYLRNGTYLSQDSIKKKRGLMFSGKRGKFLDILFRGKMGSKPNRHFKNEGECTSYFKKIGFRKVKILHNNSFIVYKAEL